jgi:hypothetical protein
MGASDNHKMLCDLGAVFCRTVWQCWPVAIEPQGLTARNYDVLAIQSSPRSIIGLEIKVSREDFIAGIKKGHFDKSNYISELWLVYPGNFKIQELPDYVGILKVNKIPRCKYHFDLKTVCDPNCNNKKSIFLSVVREAKYMHDDNLRHQLFNQYTPKWLWKIATSNSTKVIHQIEYNLLGEIEINETENS